MPTYSYECPVHNVFEADHSISIILEECPKCKEEGVLSPIKRLISKGTNFVLAGGGWAKEGYK